MKKYIFINLGKKNNSMNIKRWIVKSLKHIGLFIVGVSLALFIGWLVYPEFCLTKVDTEVTIVDKVGKYTYYELTKDRYKTFHKKEDNPHNIGENIILQIKTKDHPKYKYGGNVCGEKIIFVLYSIFTIILFIVYIFNMIINYLDYRFIHTFFSGFMIISIIISIVMLIQWWS